MSSNMPIDPKKPEYTSLEKYLSSEETSASPDSSKIKHVKSILNTKLSRLGHLMKTFFQPGKHAEWVNDKEIFARLENRIKTLEDYVKPGNDLQEDQIHAIAFISKEISLYKDKLKDGTSNSEKLNELEKRFKTFDSEIKFDDQKKLALSGNAVAQKRVVMMYQMGLGNFTTDDEKIECFKLAADKGDAVAQYELGKMYCLGKGVDESFGEAFKYTMKAAQQGHAEAQNELGAMYKEGIGTEKSDEEALKWFQLAADQGNARGQYNLAKMYKDGVGVEQSDGKAFEYIEKAAVQGLAAAESTLGEIYYKGLLGQKTDLHQAAKWFRRAAAQGDANAHYYLGELYKRNYFNDEVFSRGGWHDLYRITAENFKKAADGGIKEAQYELGKLYLEGRGVEKSEINAFKYVKKAAEQGLGEAQNKLGEMYRDGIGTEKSDLEAVKWFEESLKTASAEGLVHSQAYLFSKYNLAVMRLEGRVIDNTEELKKQAFEFITGLAEKGFAFVQNKLGEMYRDGIVPITGNVTEPWNQEALKWFKEAANQGDPRAQYNLGMMYLEGRGVVKSDESNKVAFEYLKKAADQGFAAAQNKLGHIYGNIYFNSPYEAFRSSIGLKMRGLTNQDHNEAVKWYRRAAEQGDAEAHYNLGKLYEYVIISGNDRLKDKEFWKGDSKKKQSIIAGHFEKAAAQHHPMALYTYGMLLLNGRGVGQSDEKALTCFNEAVDLGIVRAKVGVLLAGAGVLVSQLKDNNQENLKEGLKAQAEVKIQEIADFLVDPGNHVSEEEQKMLEDKQKELREIL